MTERVKKEYDKVGARSRARCESIFGFYAKDGPGDLIKSQFRNEGRFSIGNRGGARVQIVAFKAGQLRVYGGLIPNSTVFVCTEIDSAKKQNLADQDKLKRAARKLGKIMQYDD